MSSDLREKLQTILKEKEFKILPENIASGITIFDVTGTGQLKDLVDEADNLAMTKEILYGRGIIPYITDGLQVYFDLKNNAIDRVNDLKGTDTGMLYRVDEDLQRIVARNNESAIEFSVDNLVTTDLTLSILAKSTGNATDYNFMLTLFKDSLTADVALSLCSYYGKLAVDVCFTVYPTEIDFNADENWHMYTVTLENSNTIKLYKDAQLVMTKTHTLNVGTKGFIGRWANPTFYFNGYLSDALIYNRALTAEEILENYNQSGITEEV